MECTKSDWYKRVMLSILQNCNTNRHFGFFLDTDNYVTNESKPLTDKELVKEIFTLSLAVEKDIYSNLSDL